MASKRMKCPLELDSVPCVQPSSDSDDNLSSPEYLLSMQPVEDDYSSDDDARKNGESRSTDNNAERQNRIFTRSGFHSTPELRKEHLQSASSLFPSYLVDNYKAVHITEDPEQSFFQAQDASIESCVEQLLDFTLRDAGERKTVVDGNILFDGKSTLEICQFWNDELPCIKWLQENFNNNIENYDWKFKEPAKCQKNFRITEMCSSFVDKFIEHLKILKTYEQPIIVSSAKDEVHNKFKFIMSNIAKILNIEFRGNGQCKHIIPISNVTLDKFQMVRTDEPIVSEPDLVLKTREGNILMPVKVYTPELIPENIGIGISGELNFGQIQQEEKRFKAQHVIQHIGLLYEKLLTVNADDEMEFCKPWVSIGLFVNKRTLSLSKVKTSQKHMSSFIPILLPKKILTCGLESDEVSLAMHQNCVEGGLVVSKSSWCLDLCKGTHRNALFVFLVHYLWGHRYFVENDFNGLPVSQQ